MADSSAVDTALVGKLLADGALMAVLTDGVFLDQAPSGARAFAVVSQQAHEDTYTQPDTSAYETFTYLVKAVVAATTIANVKTAAARIQVLLNGGTLSPTGYTLMRMNRIGGRIAMAQNDPNLTEAHWQHRGGLYEVVVQPS